jgi:hypothetical protein
MSAEDDFAFLVGSWDLTNRRLKQALAGVLSRRNSRPLSGASICSAELSTSIRRPLQLRIILG